MEAKEKANELVESFLPYSDYNECDVFTQRENQLKNAKQCALICIGEILENITEEVMTYKPFMMNSDYWQEVKEEINKL
jgi:hypothetical protein